MSDDPKSSGVWRQSVIEKHAGAKVSPVASLPAASSLPDMDQDSYPGSRAEIADAFSTVNRAGRHHQVMLTLRLLSGDCKAFGYSYLASVDFKPGAALLLEFTGHKVTIKGRNLLPLFEGIAAHKVGVIQQSDSFTDQSEETATAVHSISVEEAR